MNLESRARRAVDSLKASVAALTAPAGPEPERSRRRLVGGLALGGALAAAMLVVALLVLPSPGDSQTVAGDIPTTAAPTTSPGTSGAAIDGTTTTTLEGTVSPPRTYPEQGGPIGPERIITTTTTIPSPPTTAGGTDSEARHYENGASQAAAPQYPGGEGLTDDFWAAQAYSCSAEEDPVELFYGGGRPGEIVKIDSPYGTAEAVVDEDGFWQANVAFEGAPRGEAFAVTVAGEDTAWEFSFTATDPAGGPCQPPVEFWFSAYQTAACSMENPPAGLFYGSGTPGDTIVLTSPYGSAEALVDENGYWEASLVFEGAPYDEYFMVDVAAPSGEVWGFSFLVPNPETGSCWSFEAYQGSGCSAEQPPTEFFWGTGAPGTEVVLSSPYGGASVVIDDSGYWQATLTFEGAPAGEMFTIEVTGSGGTVWAFPFIVADPNDGSCWAPVEPPCREGECPTQPPVEFWFSAYQTAACSMENPPAGLFYGSGTPGDTIVLTSPYGSAEALVDENGYWEASLTFEGAPYDEYFMIDVAAPSGEVWGFSFLVPNPETGSCWSFEAYQGSGCSAEQPPTEFFWGTGAPGETITLTSPYGSAEAVVDEWGYWEARMLFEGAPAGETFTIEVGDSGGTILAFSFLVAGEEGCVGIVVPPCPPEGCGVEPGVVAPVYPDTVEIVFSADDPGRVAVLVTGFLPTPCHVLAWDLNELSPEGMTVLDLYSVVEGDQACAEILQPFAETIDLGLFAPGSYVLVLNGAEYAFEV